MACVHYFKDKSKKLHLCGRNIQRLRHLALALRDQEVPVQYSVHLEDLVPEADIIICAASSSDIKLTNCKKGVIIGDAGYPKNLESSIECRSGSAFVLCRHGTDERRIFFHSRLHQLYVPSPRTLYIHGCVIEAMVLAFEKRYETYSAGRGNISTGRMEEIYSLSLKHGIALGSFLQQERLLVKRQDHKNKPA